MAQVQTQAPSETELEEFHERFMGFIETLNDRERQIVGTIIVAGYSWPAKVHEMMGDGEANAPSDEELEAVVRKLDDLHDSLPGEQHQVLDVLVGAALGGEDADVQPYGSWLWMKPGTSRQAGAYMKACFRQGGDMFSWNIVLDRRTGKVKDLFGCYKAT